MKRFRNGYWNNFDNIVKHITEVMQETGGFLPSKCSLIHRGYGGMVDSIVRRKLWPKIVKHFGMEMKKKCYLCKEIKPIAAFRKTKIGLRNSRYFVCGPCEKVYSAGYKYRTVENFLKCLLGTIKGRSKKDGIAYKIDYDFVYAMYKKQQGRCALTGIVLEVKRPDALGGVRSPYSISIDRINPHKGYLKNNIRIVCWSINNSLNVYGEGVYEKVAIEFLKRKHYIVRRYGKVGG